jgi:cytochrome c-type biogenesis protein CcmH/NrfG
VLWVLFWLVLVLAAAGAFFLLGRDLWRKARALTRELGVATDRLTEVTDRLAELSEPRLPGEPNRR